MQTFEQALHRMDTEADRLTSYPDEIMRRMAQVERLYLTLQQALERHLPEDIRALMPELESPIHDTVAPLLPKIDQHLGDPSAGSP